MERTALSYALALAALVATVGLRWLLDPWMGDTLQLVTLLGAVALAVWLGGYRPAILVAMLGYVACAYLFLQPRGSLGLDELGNVVGLIAFAFTCTLIIAFGEAMRRARARDNEQRETLRVTLRSIGDAVITTDNEGSVTYLNEAAESLTGWSQAEALGRPLDTVFRIVDEATRQPARSPATRALCEGVVVGLANHTLLISKDGAELPIDDSAAPIRDENGLVSGCVLIFMDVTKQRSAQRQKTSELHAARLLASIVATSNDAVISKSLDGIVQSWNAAAEELFGYPAAQAIGRHISFIIPPERLAEEDHIVARLKTGRRTEHFETERLHADGRRVLVSLTISPVQDDDGHIVGASKIVRDITERKLAEAERQRFVTLVENSRDFTGISDLQGKPIFVNRAGLELVGLDSLEHARRIPVRDFFFPEDQAKIENEFLPGVIEKGHGEIEVRFRNFKTGEARWMAYKVLALTDENQKPVALATVSQDVTEQRRLADDLRHVASDLSDADSRKNEFLATLAHELRGPLAPLSNMLEVWKLGGDDPELVNRARETMDRQLGQLVRLVDDLLDVNRISHNRFELRRTRVDLSAVIQQAVEASRPLAESAGHDLQVQLPSEPCYLDADPARLAQTFGNLINNSCKYTNPGGTIQVSAARDRNDVVVSVKDTGIGIPADRLHGIFDMFTQVDGSLERAQGGLGIGLALVKQLVEMHGGSVEAKSAGEGLGTEFIVRLPVLADEPGIPAAVPVVARKPAAPRRILVVDDNRDSAVSLAMLLELEGNETYAAHDGVAALDAIERHRPEIVLLDIGLPKMDGHQVCRRVREQAWGKDIVIVALTGWGQEEDHRRSREAGFDGHLVKPVDHAKLQDLLTPLVSRFERSVG